MLHSVLANPGVNDLYEVLVFGGTKTPHGDKINYMVEKAQGSHIVIHDDDDWITTDYVAQVEPFNQDFVGHRIVAMVNGRYDQTVSHSARDEGWNGHQRGVSQKCPIRREIALKVPYPSDYYQDGTWSAEIQTHVESDVFVDRDLYFYDFQVRDRYRSVGMWPYEKQAVRWL